MKMALLGVAGLSLDDAARVMERAVDNVVTCVSEIRDYQHNLCNSGRQYTQDRFLTLDRLQRLNEVEGFLLKAKELLRRL